MTATVRSVDVRLNAIVSKYISEMRRAGRETDRAFASSQGNVRDLNRELGTATQRVQAVDQSAKGMNTTLGRSNTRVRALTKGSRELSSELATVRTGVGRLNGGGSDSIVTLGRNSQRSGRQLDSFSGRVGLIAQALAVLGPAAIPITAEVIPALAGLSNQLAFGVAAAGTAVIAFQGVGDALKSLDKARIEPTTANLEAAQDAMQELAPAGQNLVKHLYSLRGEWQRVRGITQTGLFPGLDSGLDALDRRIPQVERILFQLSDSLGDALGSGARSLSSTEWDGFFDFLEHEARPTLDGLAEATGNVASGAAQMWMAFAPLEHDWTDWLVRGTESFEQWASRLQGSTEFSNFIAYIRTEGPQVGETLLAWANAIVQIVQAAAPLGGPVLQGLEAFADILATVADSDLGTPIFTALAGMALLSRATQLWGATSVASTRAYAAGLAMDARGIFAVTSAQQRASLSATALARQETVRRQTGLAAIGKTGAAIGALALLSTGAADGIGLTNTATLALAGSMAGPLGTAAGATVGTILDIRASSKNAGDALRAFQAAMESGDPAAFATALEQVNAQLERQTSNTVVGTGFLGDSLGSLVNVIAPLSNVDKTVGQLTGSTKDLTEASKETAPAAQQAAAAQDRYAAATQSSGRVNRITAAQIRGATAAMEEQRSEALAAFDAVTQYAEALASARRRAKNTEAGIDENTKAGRKNRDMLSGLAAAWNNQSDAVRNNVGKYRSARQAFIDTAREMGVGREKARALAKALLEVPQSIETQYQFFPERARSQIALIKRELAGIDREISTNYYVNQISRIMKPKVLPGNPDGSADGSTVPKGGTYADRHLYLLAPGEEVISNRHGQADRHRGLLKDINAGRLADGGTAGRVSLDDRLAIAEALQQLRDLTRQLNDRVDKGKNKGEFAVRGLNRRLLQLQIDAAQRDLRAAKTREVREARQAAREAKQAAREDVRSSAAGAFSNDIFGGTLADLSLQLRADKNDANAVTKALAIAAGNGLHGDLATGLAGSGNVGLAQEFAAASPAEIRRLMALFGGRATAQRDLGRGAVLAGEGSGRTARVVGRLADVLEDLPGQVGDAVYAGTYAGAAQETHNRNRRVTNRRRTPS